jgi:hypothetical protein
MKRNLLVLALLVLGSVAVSCNPASAFGDRLFGCFCPGHCLSRYVNVQVCTPYNAFTPFCGGYSHNYGVTNGCCGQGCGSGGCNSGCGVCGPLSPFGGFCGPVGPVCAAPSPYLPGNAYAQMPYAPMPMMPAPMHAMAPYGGYYGYGVQPASYGYGVQPASYLPASYPMHVDAPPMRNAFGN